LAYDLAKEKLNPKELELLQPDCSGESVFSVLQEAQKIEKELDRKKWRYKKGDGEVIVVRDKFDRIVKGLDRYANIVDVAINQHPDIVSICWASARFLLKVTFPRCL
jgi:hypothetical protein